MTEYASVHSLAGCKMQAFSSSFWKALQVGCESLVFISQQALWNVYILSFQYEAIPLLFPGVLTQSLTDSQTCQLSSILSRKNELKIKYKALKDTEARTGTGTYL